MCWYLRTVEKAYIRMPRQELWYCMRKVGESPERWRYEVSRSKIEYVCVHEKATDGKLKLRGAEVVKVDQFKYLGLMQCNGQLAREAKGRVLGWSAWRRVSVVICDRRIVTTMKVKVSRMVARPAMMYGTERPGLLFLYRPRLCIQVNKLACEGKCVCYEKGNFLL